MAKLLKKILYVLHLVQEIRFFRTVWFNLRFLPLNQAIHLPILIYPHVQIIGLYRGCIQLTETPRFGSIKIGFARWPISPTKNVYTLLRFEENGILKLGNNCTFKCGFSICVYKNANLTIGNDLITNMNTKILCKKKISIGNHCLLGWNAQIYDSNFHFIYNEQNKTISPCHGEVIINDNVWVTNQCTISKGAVIPAFSMVSSGSLLCKDFSGVTTKGNVFAGRPAKLLRTGLFCIVNVKAERRLLEYFEKNPDSDSYEIDVFDGSMLEN